MQASLDARLDLRPLSKASAAIAAMAADGSSARLSAAQRTPLIDRVEAAAGVALCGVWNLPEPVSTTIDHWRDDAYRGPWERQICQVRLAELLASRSLGQPADELAQPRIQAAIERLQMNPDEVAALASGESAVQQALLALDGVRTAPSGQGSTRCARSPR